jgi:hypothetical protein
MRFLLLPFPTPEHCIRKLPQRRATPVEPVVGPAEETVAEVDAVVDVAVDAAGAEAERCEILLESGGARN